MMKKVASALSLLLHPFLMPTLGLLVIFSTQSHITFIPFEYRRLIVIIVLVSTCILPLSIMPLLLQLHIIKSMQMETARERLVPLLSTAAFFMVGYFFLKKFHPPTFITLFYLGTLVAVLLSLFISFFWKISIHTLGIGGLLGALLAIWLKYGVTTHLWMLGVLVAAGLIGSSRLLLGAHNPKQVYAGFLLGVAVLCSMVLL